MNESHPAPYNLKHRLILNCTQPCSEQCHFINKNSSFLSNGFSPKYSFMLFYFFCFKIKWCDLRKFKFVRFQVEKNCRRQWKMTKNCYSYEIKCLCLFTGKLVLSINTWGVSLESPLRLFFCSLWCKLRDNSAELRTIFPQRHFLQWPPASKTLDISDGLRR